MNDFILLISLVPGILICVLAYIFLNKRLKEPIVLLIGSFICGVIVSFAAFYFERYLFLSSSQESPSFVRILKEAFLWVAFPEEVLKLFVLFLFGLYAKTLDKPLDFILYSLFISMGFASVENMLYGYLYGLETTVIRALTAIPAHATFGIFMGAGIAAYFIPFTKWRKWLIFFGTLFVVTILHGIYDIFIIQEYSESLLVGSLICLIIYIIGSFWVIKRWSRIQAPAS